MKHPEFRFLATLTAHLGAPQKLGATPAGDRKTVPVNGGTVEGDRLSGAILPGGGDWALTTGDGVLHLDVRLTICTGDDALINVSYTGKRHGPPDLLEALARGEQVDPNKIYFRIQPNFETADARYAWLNRVLAVGIGERIPVGPRYNIFELL